MDVLRHNLDVMCRIIRPTWGDVMQMDEAMLHAVAERLPLLDGAEKVLAHVFGGKK